jgi:hypothetical protein
MIRHEHNIEAMRGELTATIGELENRLNPAAITARAGEAVKEATVGRMGRAMDAVGDNAGGMTSSVVDRIRSNPLPVALVGLGAAWLFLGGRKAEPVRRQTQQSVSELADQASDQVERVKTAAVERAGSLQGALGQSVNESPLPLGIAAVALGAIAALALPKTAAEERVMGEARNRVLQETT